MVYKMYNKKEERDQNYNRIHFIFIFVFINKIENKNYFLVLLSQIISIYV